MYYFNTLHFPLPLYFIISHEGNKINKINIAKTSEETLLRGTVITIYKVDPRYACPWRRNVQSLLILQVVRSGVSRVFWISSRIDIPSLDDNHESTTKRFLYILFLMGKLTQTLFLRNSFLYLLNPIIHFIVLLIAFINFETSPKKLNKAWTFKSFIYNLYKIQDYCRGNLDGHFCKLLIKISLDSMVL